MKIKEFLETPPGLYRMYWKSGGWSLAAIGMDEKGKRWIACTNWVNPATWERDVINVAHDISSISLIEAQNESN